MPGVEITIPGNIHYATFYNRPNRFLVNLTLEGTKHLEQAYLHDPGRMKELLLPQVRLLIRQPQPKNGTNKRKTKWDILAVEHQNRIVVINSRLPNIVAANILKKKKLPELKEYTLVRPEISYGNSRLDFYLKKDTNECYLEVKGVTLVAEKKALFPDAPTTRGVRHLKELMKIRQEGKKAVVLFLVMREDPSTFGPNETTDPIFTQTLLQAYKSGVEILVYKVKPILQNKKLVLQFGEKINWSGTI
ncbi:MAG: DNA/RNA nuclease SfsA [Candidatus Heimdallarchaeota archaeon]|nr:MAG: DNA/RNA nuclease SfsA [Candidatus Gerdarchaeota archaeon]RLI72847.1 MAG: DNA/RNA nuclease SfsA [Candidatus Gerdarchaeota archaeon]